jgi:hypothetical protein
LCGAAALATLSETRVTTMPDEDTKKEAEDILEDEPENEPEDDEKPPPNKGYAVGSLQREAK